MRDSLRSLLAVILTFAGQFVAASEPTLPDFESMSPTDVDALIDIYNEMLQLNADDSTVALQRGCAFLVKKDLDKSIADFEAVILHEPNLASPYRFRAKARLQQQRVDAAIVDLNEAIRLDPENSMLYAERGFAFAINEEPSLAEADFAKSIDQDPRNSLAYRNRGFLWSKQCETSKAISDFDRAIQLEPMHGPTYVMRALHRAIRKKWKDAFRDFDEAFRLNPNDANTYYQRAMVNVAKNDRQNAINDLSSAIQLDSNHVLAYSFRGWQWMLLGNLSASIEDFNEVLRLDPRNSDGYWARTIVRHHRKEYGKALLDTLLVNDLNPRILATSDLIYIAKELLRSCDEKVAKLSGDVAEDAQHASILRDRGMAYLALERWNEAIDHLDRAIQLDQSSSLSYIVRGKILLHQREWDRAIDDFSTALRLSPREASVLSDRGVAFAHKEDWSAACDDFSAAIELDPRDLRSMARRGAALHALGKLELAMSDYDHVISGEPFYVHVSIPRSDAEKQAPEFKPFDPKGLSHTNPTTTAAPTAFDWSSLTSFATGKSIIPQGTETAKAPQNSQPGSTNAPATNVEPIKHSWHAFHLDSDYLMAYMNRAKCFEMQGEWTKALNDYRQLTRLAPADSQAFQRIAWLRATCPNLEFRNGEEAVQFAKLADERSHSLKQCFTLAAAYAEFGEFEKAVEYQSQSQVMVSEDWQKELLAYRQQYKALEFRRLEDTTADPEYSNGQNTIEAALKACECSRWEDAKLIDALADAYAAVGRFDDALGCREESHAITVEPRDKRILELLELYRSGKSFPSDPGSRNGLFDETEMTNIVPTQEMRTEDDAVVINGIPKTQLSMVQLRLLSIETKPDLNVDPIERTGDETKPEPELQTE